MSDIISTKCILDILNKNDFCQLIKCSDEVIGNVKIHKFCKLSHKNFKISKSENNDEICTMRAVAIGDLLVFGKPLPSCLHLSMVHG